MQLPIKENVVFKFTDVKLNKEINSSLLGQKRCEVSESSKLLSQVKDCNALSDQSNPIIQQIVFFAKMFENFTNNDLKKSKEEIESEFHTKINQNNSYQDFILNSLNEKREFLNIETLKQLIYRTYSKTKDNSKQSKNEENKKMKKIMSLIIYLQMRKIEMKLNYFNEFEKQIQSENQQLKSMESQIIQDRIKLAMKKSEINQLARKFMDIINPVNSADDPATKNISLYNLNGVHNNNFEKILDLNEEMKKQDINPTSDVNILKSLKTSNIDSDQNMKYGGNTINANGDIKVVENSADFINPKENADYEMRVEKPTYSNYETNNNGAKEEKICIEINGKDSQQNEEKNEENNDIEMEKEEKVNNTINYKNCGKPKEKSEDDLEKEEDGEFEEKEEEEYESEMEEDEPQELDQSGDINVKTKSNNRNNDKEENEAVDERNKIETLNCYQREEDEEDGEEEEEEEEEEREEGEEVGVGEEEEDEEPSENEDSNNKKNNLGNNIE